MATYELGMIGLGTMGRNLLLNMSDHGHAVAGWARDPAKAERYRQEFAGRDMDVFTDMAEFVASLQRPRRVILLVTAGQAVDDVIAQLVPLLEPGDLIIDGGNSLYSDTERRERELSALHLLYLGVGVSGGEDGARLGPSMMAGGTAEAYGHVQRLLENVSAKSGGEPCVALLGPHSAGHFVKMVHNGIEYAIMQLIAESYDLMRRGIGLSADAIGNVFDRWAQSEMGGFLLEITAKVMLKQDPEGEGSLVDVVKDVAKQKGTGRWTSQAAMDLHAGTPSIDVAVAMRDLSGQGAVREAVRHAFAADTEAARGEFSVTSLERALYVAVVIAYAQGMAALRLASEARGYGLDLAQVAAVWREGCIIRSRLLEPIRAAYARDAQLPHLLADPTLAEEVMARLPGLRETVRFAAEAGIPAPAMMVSLGYLDSLRSETLPANLIQAQRDAFGAHTYERIDREGTFHTAWLE